MGPAPPLPSNPNRLSKSVIYWDHNATSPLRVKVKDAMVDALERYHANASSAHSAGLECRMAIERSRRTLADVLKCDISELVFTSSASESNLMSIWGLWLSRTEGHPERRQIITSPLEHNSVYENLMFLKNRFGAEVIFAPLTDAGTIDVAALETLMDPEKVAFVTTIGAHNEVGIVQPWQEIAALSEAKGIPFHVDLVQCFIRESLDLGKSKVSAVTLCFHKSGGPKGVGLLYIRNKTKLEPLVRGGGQEKARRAGTENITAIVGAGALAEEAASLQTIFDSDIRRVRDFFEDGLRKLDKGIKIVGEKAKRIPNTTYATFERMKSDVTMMQCDLEGICVSTGSACSSGLPKPSRALLSLGFSEAEALTGVRFSLGPSNSLEEAEKVLKVLSVALSKRKAA